MSQIQQKINYYRAVDKAFDFFLILVCIFLGYFSERVYHLWGPYSQLNFQYLINNIILPYEISSFNYKYALPLFVITTLISIISIEKKFIYRTALNKDIFKNAIKIAVISLFSILSIEFLLKLDNDTDLFARSTIVFYTGWLFFILALKRIVYKQYLSKIRIKGKDDKNIVIIGSVGKGNSFIDNVINHKEFGFNISAVFYEKNINNKYDELRYENINNFYKVLINETIDEVFIADLEDKSLLNDIIEKIENVGISYHLLINVDRYKIQKSSEVFPVIDKIYNMPMISFYTVSANYYKLIVKNLCERIFAFLLLVITMPIVVISILLIMSTSRGNPVFLQERVGLRNRKFYQYKLRTMYVGSDHKKKELLDKNEHDGPVFKMTNDPRVTPVGRILRKYSIDELPQLVNILKGDMNLIGPRPPIPDEVKSYKIEYYRRFSFKPGITGLWQISGRNKIKNFEDWIALDLKYIDTWSLKNDFLIALKTVPEILKGSGK